MDILPFLNRIPHYKLICKIAKDDNINIWLVGGFLRDIHLAVKRQLIDFDFCVGCNTGFFARKFARSLGAKCIVLDKQNQSFRVILKKQKTMYTYDFTLIRGDTISDDLALRDFSINSLAVDLTVKSKKVIDLWNARKDLKRKILTVIRKEVIADDPLRILRGFSFLANYGFCIEPETLKIMGQQKKMLSNVSPERINEELFKILRSADSFKAIKLMDKIRIIDQIIPEISQARGVSQGKYHHLDVWNHSLEALKKFESFCRKQQSKNSKIFSYLNEEISSGRRRFQIIKLACILHDIGKPLAKKKINRKIVFYTHEKIGRDLSEKIADSLRFSFKEKDLLRKLVFWHLRPGYLSGQASLTSRSVYRFFRDTQNEGISVILLSLADWRATRGVLISDQRRRKYERIMFNLIKLYFSMQEKTCLKKIVDGHWLIKKFKLESGPLIGELLKAVQEEQALGKVINKNDACKVIKEIIKRHSMENKIVNNSRQFKTIKQKSN